MRWERSGIYRVWWVRLKKREDLEDVAGRWEGNIRMCLKYDGFRPGQRQVTGFLTAVFPMIRCCWHMMLCRLVCSFRRLEGSSALIFRLG